MGLADVPVIPLLKIARYLDERSMVKLRLSCYRIFRDLTSNRHLLVERAKRKVYMVKIKRIEEPSPDIPKYSVEVIKRNGLRDSTTSVQFSYSMKNNVINSPLLEWLTYTFSNHEIDILHLEKMCFESEHMEDVDILLRENKIKIARVWLVDAVISDGTLRRIIKFLTDITPTFLGVWDRKTMQPKDLLKNLLLQMMVRMPQLDLKYEYMEYSETNYSDYEVLRLAELPTSIDRISQRFFTSFFFAMDFQHFKSLIHDWYHNEERRIVHWVVSIICDLDVTEMAERLELRFRISKWPPTFYIARSFEAQLSFTKFGHRNNICAADEWSILS